MKQLSNKRLPLGRAILSACVVAAAATLVAAPASAQTVLRMTSFEPEGIAGHRARAFGEAIEQATGGDVTVEFYWSGSLLPATQMAAGISDGIADVGMILPPYNPSEFPIANWATVLGSLAEPEFPRNMLQAAAASAEAFLQSEVLLEEFDRQGLVLLTPIFSYPGFDLLCNEAVTTLEQAKGKRVRVGGNLWAAEAQAVGMEPVALPGSDVYQAAQRGIVDCVMQHPPGFVGNGVWEVLKHFSPTQFTGWNAMYLVMGKNRWESLDDSQRIAVRNAAADYFVAAHESSLRDYARFAAEGSEQHDVVFHGVGEDLGTAIAAAQAAGIADAVETAPASLTNPEAFIASYRAAMEKWKGLLFENGDLAGIAGSQADDARSNMAAAGELDLSPWAERVSSEIFGDAD